MKKVNILLVVMYLNTLLLFFVCLYIFSSIPGKVIINNREISSEQINNSYEYLPTMFWIWVVLFSIVGVINIVSVILDFLKNETNILYKKMKRVKLGLIPYWLFNFLFYIPISFSVLVIGHGFGFIFIPLLIFASYIVLLQTSTFSFAYLLSLRRNSIISNKQLIVQTIWQLIFMIDIIGTIYIIRKFGKSKIR